MKKIFLSFFIIAFVMVNVQAQQGPAKTFKPETQSFPSLNFKASLPPFQHSMLRLAGVEWFNYLNSVVYYNQLNYPSIVPLLHADYLFPDSGINAYYHGFSVNPDVHSLATIMDPRSYFFSLGHSFIVGPTDSFTVDSTAFTYYYYRNPASNVVDTLQLNVFGASNGTGSNPDVLSGFFNIDPNNGANYGYDTLAWAAIPYNRATHRPIIPYSINVKIPLTKSTLADTIAGGANLAVISTAALGYLHAPVIASASFLPGYHYTLNDTLNNLNYVLFASLEENGDSTYPYYLPGDYNQSYVVNTPVQYNIDQSGYDSLYVPTIAFGAPYPYEVHEFAFLIHCASCLNIATDTKNTTAPVKNNLLVFPNPCTTCQLSGVTNVNDLQVMDLLGRTVNTSFTKSAGGYQMSLPNASGLFFIRNIKTGEVVKFVKE